MGFAAAAAASHENRDVGRKGHASHFDMDGGARHRSRHLAMGAGFSLAGRRARVVNVVFGIECGWCATGSSWNSVPVL